MLKFRLLLPLLFLMTFASLYAQVYDGNVSCYNQEAVDSMINYSSITGSIRIDPQYVIDGSISGSDIKNLDGLSNLTSIGGSLVIFWTDSLTNVDGFSNLTSVGNFLALRYNTRIANLDGFHNITSAKNLWLDVNVSLTDITGLSGITSVDTLWITWNSSLSSLEGLSVSGPVTELELFRNRLLNLDPISGITSVSDSIVIAYEPYLTDLDGLSNIVNANGVHIWYDNNLRSFCGLYPLLSGSGFGGDYFVQYNQYNPGVEDIMSMRTLLRDTRSYSKCRCG